MRKSMATSQRDTGTWRKQFFGFVFLKSLAVLSHVPA